ncbi:MAG: hypothetical protein OXH39_05585 [Candidatus Poribacteria bacterium]|nr:hypothetical protein [Candidatus Poribacteria bacterium]
MKFHKTSRWIPIVILLLVATLSFAQHFKDATQTPCRPTPEICHPRTQPPPCQPFICPDTDRR